MKRSLIRLDDVADPANLVQAFWRAAQGKRHRPEVQRFERGLDGNLSLLRFEILSGAVSVGEYHRFEIHDPKRRTIHAPCFRERVLHHALMAFVEPVLDRYLIDDTFACRKGKGSWAAALRAQRHGRRCPWYLKLDIRSYFASIDHGMLKRQIRRRLRGKPVLHLVDRILDAHQAAPGKGLPIGALTSQHFANLYLSPLDRFLLEEVRVKGLVRYMDDLVVWHRDRQSLRTVLERARAFASEHLRLEIKPSWQLQRSPCGLSLCGFRIFPGRLGLTARRRRRYRQARRKWEESCRSGRITAEELQAGYSSALAITHGAECLHWRRAELAGRPAVEA